MRRVRPSRFVWHSIFPGAKVAEMHLSGCTPDIETRQSARGVRLNLREVHLWTVDLAQDDVAIDRCRGLLSRDEVQRADRFHFKQDQNRFIGARAAMREILSKYLYVAPTKIAFSYAFCGKPELDGKLRESEIEFNLSHSHGIALVGVARKMRIGVDIEFVDSHIAIDEISARFFSAWERCALHALPPEERIEGFFRCWTRKEAYIKALGNGLSIPLDRFEVEFGPATAAVSAPMENALFGPFCGRLYKVDSPRGYTAALAVEGGQHALRQWEWKPGCEIAGCGIAKILASGAPTPGVPALR